MAKRAFKRRRHCERRIVAGPAAIRAVRRGEVAPLYRGAPKPPGFRAVEEVALGIIKTVRARIGSREDDDKSSNTGSVESSRQCSVRHVFRPAAFVPWYCDQHSLWCLAGSASPQTPSINRADNAGNVDCLAAAPRQSAGLGNEIMGRTRCGRARPQDKSHTLSAQIKPAKSLRARPFLLDVGLCLMETRSLRKRSP